MVDFVSFLVLPGICLLLAQPVKPSGYHVIINIDEFSRLTEYFQNKCSKPEIYKIKMFFFLFVCLFFI